MGLVSVTLTVYFDDPFWVGVVETLWEGKLQVAKITFGAEPRDYEVYALLMQRWQTLRFSSPANAGGRPAAHANARRMRRRAAKALHGDGVGTKSQQAISRMTEQGRQLRRAQKSRRTQEEKQQRFDLKQQKKKEKHRGR